MRLKEALKKKLTKKELGILRGSFDVIGDIAIIEVPLELKKKQKIIGETLLGMLKHVKTVAVKEGKHKGKYRRQKMKIVAGEKNLKATHKESGVKLKVNVETCYYSPRLGTERLRIAKQVKKGERVLVVGSGVGPYPIIISKNTKAKEIVGVEINPVAHKYAEANVKLNKVTNVKLLKGDICKKRPGKFDRIILAAPHEGVKLIPPIIKMAKKGTKLHVLDFAPENKFKEASDRVKEEIKCRILRVVKAGQHATRSYRVCVDAQIL